MKNTACCDPLVWMKRYKSFLNGNKTRLHDRDSSLLTVWNQNNSMLLGLSAFLQMGHSDMKSKNMLGSQELGWSFTDPRAVASILVL